jgi:hypothetical protein
VTEAPAPDVADRAISLLRERQAGAIAHPGGDLLSHLVRTKELLQEWGASGTVCLAGLCHAIYGTDGLPTALVSLDQRDTVRDLIGDAAEAIVYRYGSCDRTATYSALGGQSVEFTDRFTGAVELVTDAELERFALLSIANELDIVRVGKLGPSAVEAVTDLVERLAPYAPEVAARVLTELRSLS